MAVERIVRVTRTWDVSVKAEYGDDDQALLDRATAGSTGASTESKNLLPAEDAA